jgi:hypothetical protein
MYGVSRAEQAESEGGRLSGSIFYLVTVNWLIGPSAHY